MTMEWQTVPKEPTQEMLLAYAKAWERKGIRGLSVGEIARREYHCMLAAAPRPDQQDGQLDRLRDALAEIRDSDSAEAWCREIAREALTPNV
jgi:hypothetical protein